MDFSEGKTVVEMIREKYNQIFMAERKVADFVLENPERAVNANVSELANLSGVSDATVIRFCKRIGFQGHYQFRITLSRDLGRIMGGYSRKENEGEDQTAAGLFQSYARKISAIGKHIRGNHERMREPCKICGLCSCGGNRQYNPSGQVYGVPSGPLRHTVHL